MYPTVSTRFRAATRFKKQADVREQILTAATLIASEQGWQELSMRKIARHIRLSATMIYEYFTGKDDLLDAIVQIGFRRLLAVMNSARLTAKSPPDQLAAIWRAYVRFAVEDATAYRLMFGIRTGHLPGKPALTGIASVCAMVGEVTSKINQQKLLPGEVTEGKSHALWAAAHGIATLRLTGGTLPEHSYQDILTDALTIIVSN